MGKELQVYVNLPFCIHRCAYCGVLVKTGDSAAKGRYLGALEDEMDAAVQTLGEYDITSIYLGGGSPSIFNPDDMAHTINTLRDHVDLVPHAEVGIEMMPQTVGTPSLTGLGAARLNRMSLSMQSGDQDELKALDCGFTLTDVENSILFMRKFGVRNLNIDLMYGNPLQTMASWEQTLFLACGYGPEHISIYPFTAPYAEGMLPCPSAAEQEDMVAFAASHLARSGYTRYSKYHFAQSGFVCRHFSDRYHGSDYIGLGLGAKSFIDGISYENTSDYRQYVEHSSEFEQVTCNVMRFDEEQLEERLATCRALLVPDASLAS